MRFIIQPTMDSDHITIPSQNGRIFFARDQKLPQLLNLLPVVLQEKSSIVSKNKSRDSASAVAQLFHNLCSKLSLSFHSLQLQLLLWQAQHNPVLLYTQKEQSWEESNKHVARLCTFLQTNQKCQLFFLPIFLSTLWLQPLLLPVNTQLVNEVTFWKEKPQKA